MVKCVTADRLQEQVHVFSSFFYQKLTDNFKEFDGNEKKKKKVSSVSHLRESRFRPEVTEKTGGRVQSGEELDEEGRRNEGDGRMNVTPASLRSFGCSA